MKKRLLASLGIILLSGCISTGRYSQHQDSAPQRLPEDIQLRDAVPAYVEYAPSNIRPYTVLGKHYTPLTTGKGYVASGRASWYGQKFHGHLTANGEIYNMFAMTAAHRTLPLPSFVKVTNLENGLSTIVKVNDRGPFHDSRLIDLSWAAAKKLDILKQGTGMVKLEVIHVDKQGQITTGSGLPSASMAMSQQTPATYIQVATSDNANEIEEIARGLAFLFHVPTHTPKTQSGYVLRLGPITDQQDTQTILTELKENGFHDAREVTLAP